MKPTKHHKFIESLKKQLVVDKIVSDFKGCSDIGSSDYDECDDQLMKELERKFDELFGPIDSD